MTSPHDMNASSVPEHLAIIDATAWPSVAAVPGGRLDRWRAGRAEARFAAACANAGIRVDGAAPDVVVDYAEVFQRVAANGWVGLAEGYLAGEWHTPDSERLVQVLRKLVQSGYVPSTLRVAPARSHESGEVPPSLIQHYAGDGVSPFQGHFATGVPTRERVRVKSYARGAGHGNEPARHFVDVTEIAAPQDEGTTRSDLADAQARSVAMLLQAAGVRDRSRVLEYPASGPAVTLAAGAKVECVTNSLESADALREQLTFAGVPGQVRVKRLGRGYDAAVSLEHLETLSDDDKAEFLTQLGSAVAPGGKVAIQTIVAGPEMNKAARAALASLRAYVWPGLSYVSTETLARIVDRKTGLRIIAETHAPQHLATSLGLQRATFDSHLRDAAANGFDPVYRRLWVWQLALRQALAELRMIDLTQLTLTARNRRGRR
ncbi:class I SAM-dependent methyltransferase [Corynebacterium hadale]|uniref:class I SAM-dependent methyltransferase n=1 Tax=Corynebacterium hadale TaxID=2026255 RepID=UPI001EF26729|nr:class I SAM-dependent methyltransferase [Corynebacterium hadale]MCG7255432.1 class I SAM-dependent methyltransferase [Corynebacterium hadale]MCG7265228.1 class I SAM-dependent methyltransferase [Corynebacterium hadale]